ncbi:HIT domain-containing protein [Nocardioides sp. zg-1308]|uniref:HIT domain-containing protein n=1 Tax=Nocardioides sp. zg-1308 TaxID=2736253 RepID=UPI00155451D4|nr:HIT domain-containing protein [Nocardioides sp. zg-1308]
MTAPDYDGTDFYCDVAVPRAVPLDVVHEDELVLAYHHTRPFWDVHVVVVPKRHIGSLTTVTTEDEADVRALLRVVQRVARQVEEEHGAAAVLTNLGAYQDSRHLHVHVHSGPQRSQTAVGAHQHTGGMDAAALLTRLAEVIDAHDWDALPDLLHPEFTCRLVHTGEVFDRDGWVRLNADYPGFQRLHLEDLVADGDRGDRGVLRARVVGTSGTGGELVFAVASFATMRDGLLSELTEVWTDVDQQAPEGTRPRQG